MGKQTSQRIFKNLGDELSRAFGNEKTQEELAKKTYVSQPAVHNWFSGKRRPQPGTLGLLAAELQLSPDYLAHLAGYDGDPDALDKVLNAYNDRRLASRRNGYE